MKYYLLIILTSVLFACNNQEQKTAAEDTTGKLESDIVELTAEQLKNAGIRTGKPEIKSIAEILKLSGAIDVPPQNLVSISFPLGGFLKYSKLIPGMHINKGEVLAIMEDEQFITLQQEYLLTKSKLELAEHEFNRQKELNEQKAGSDKVFQQAKNELQVQKILLKAIREKLLLIGIVPDLLNENTISRTVNLKSPINGYVAKVNVNTGKYVAPTDVLFELVNPEDIHLVLTVFEKDIAKIGIGQQVTAYTNDNLNRKYQAEVIFIGKTLDENRSAEVHCHFDQFDHSNLLPGMFMNGEVSIKSSESVVVPEDAIVRWQNRNYIFTVEKEGVYKMVEVEPGLLQQKMQQITLPNDQSGKEVVLENAYVLLMKMKNSAEE
jgi:cobalt-zinc-cadmium efflux system membrane fusion protein